MNYIFKNIWAQKGLNIWLFVEIVVISVLTWIFTSAETGIVYRDIHFDNYSTVNADNCVISNIIRWGQGPEFSPEQNDEFLNNVQVVYDKLCEDEDFRFVTFDDRYSGNSRLSVFGNPETQLLTRTYNHSFIPNTNFFNTYNIKSLTHNPDQLESIANGMDDHQVIITESLAQMLYGTTDVIGKPIFESADVVVPVCPDSIDQCNRYSIADVVETTLDNESDIHGYLVYKKTNLMELKEGYSQWPIILRLRDGLSAEEFFAKRNPIDDSRIFHSGGYDVDGTGAGIQCFYEFSNKKQKNTVFNTIAAVFLSLFFIDMFIGIVGTFWLQIRNRFQDISIQRSFGASRKRVIRSLICEGIVLAQIAVLVGAVIVLQFPNSINGPLYTVSSTGLETNWMTNFWPHFFIVTFIVSVIVQLFVIIGVLIPSFFHTRNLLR